MPDMLMKKYLFTPHKRRAAWRCLFVLAFLMMPLAQIQAGPLRDQFSQSNASSSLQIDHSAWEKLLQAYVVPGDDGLNRVNYAAFKRSGANKLKRYLFALQKINPATLNKSEQFAYWANFYNAITIDIILDHYPVKSIRDIRLTSFLVPGPWDKKVVRVGGADLSLNDIEHEIMRGIWRDPRVHYAVNCASVGCPNLPRLAFTGPRLEDMLDKGARDYINSARGARVIGVSLIGSKLYSWFAEDFGGSMQSLLTHLGRYATPELAAKLKQVTRISRYEYDWSLNDIK